MPKTIMETCTWRSLYSQTNHYTHDVFQGDLVRQMKEEGAPENDLKIAIAELKSRKKILEDKVC